MTRYRYNHYETKAEAEAFAEAIQCVNDPECFVKSIRHEPRSQPAWIVEWKHRAEGASNV